MAGNGLYGLSFDEDLNLFDLGKILGERIDDGVSR